MLLVIGPGPRPLRGCLLEQTAAHYPLLLINDAPPTWQRPYVIDHEVTDLSDPIGRPVVDNVYLGAEEGPVDSK
ncbi:hypothetical protein AB0P17_15845 [Streptomyces sp. NPDC088124]|uniref:hypothetical protein n=1 Tax=Streptomyces sp. NPDC088124 TaxID=3154654 RepID=UPI00341F2953